MTPNTYKLQQQLVISLSLEVHLLWFAVNLHDPEREIPILLEIPIKGSRFRK
jgi:hypothetical protein